MGVEWGSGPKSTEDPDGSRVNQLLRVLKNRINPEESTSQKETEQVAQQVGGLTTQELIELMPVPSERVQPQAKSLRRLE